MPHENRRQWERFVHPTVLQLTAGGHVLSAKLIDVSRSGMQVVAPVLLHVGDEVSASLPAMLPTPGAAGAVRGRVCWTAPARAEGTPQTRAGIAFELPLSAAEPAQESTEHSVGRSVIVQFSGAMPQVMARASSSDEGLRVRFSLPSMREGSVITLHSQDDDPKEMRVVGVRLDERRAQVELLVEPCPETRRRRFLQYHEPAPALVPLQAAAQPVHADVPIVRAAKRRVLAGAGIAASLMAAAWIATRTDGPEIEPEREVATQAITQAAPRPATVPELVSPPDKRAAPARHTLAVSGGLRPQPTAADEPSVPDPSAVNAETAAHGGPTESNPEPAAATAAEPTSGGAPASAAAPGAREVATKKPEKPLPAAASKPSGEPPRASAISLSTTKDTTEIFIPVTGSLAGLATKIWTDPPAVVVELPRASVALAKRQYDIQKDGVVGISVGRPGGVTQLRVYVNSILSQYNASAVPGGVSIRIKRDLQSLR